MSRFTAEWLRLREPHDARARSRRALEPLVQWSRSRPCIRILDLGGGTGSNLRFLAPKLESRQEWTIIDRDDALLARLRAPAAVDVASELTDMTLGFGWLDRRDIDLVTASALLDLVSAAWLDDLLQRCAARGIAVHMALTYDGTLRFEPPDAADAVVRDCLNRHQTGDKGFGPALGPTAATYAADALRRLGYRVVEDRSPWRLAPADRRLQQRLTDDWAAVAAEVEPASADGIRAWRARRSAWIAAGRSGLEVGHRDVTALPGNLL